MAGKAEETVDNVELFAGLDRKARGNLASKLRERRFRSGETIAHEQQTGVGFFLIAAGTATVDVNLEQVNRLEPGQWFGEMALLIGEGRTAAIRAETDLQCFVLPEWDFRELLFQHPDVAWRMLQELARRLRNVHPPIADHPAQESSTA